MKSKAKHVQLVDKQCDFIATSDFHLCDTAPVCRTDNVFESSLSKLRFIVQHAKENDCAILDGGDFFHKWKISNRFINEIIPILRDVTFITTPGNHDLKYHNISNIKDTSLGVLREAGAVQFEITPDKPILVSCNDPYKCDCYIHCFPFGTDLDFTVERSKGIFNIAIIHKPISMRKVKHVKTSSAKKILSKMAAQGFDLVISGDYHIPLALSLPGPPGALLVNGGGVMRLNADEIDKKPVFYKIYLDEMEAIPVEFPIEDVIQRTHITRKEDLENDNLDYIEIIASQKSNNKTLDYQKELEDVMNEVDAIKSVRTKVYELSDMEKS